MVSFSLRLNQYHILLKRRSLSYLVEGLIHITLLGLDLGFHYGDLQSSFRVSVFVTVR
jgi:hypothetical protein